MITLVHQRATLYDLLFPLSSIMYENSFHKLKGIREGFGGVIVYRKDRIYRASVVGSKAWLLPVSTFNQMSTMYEEGESRVM